MKIAFIGLGNVGGWFIAKWFRVDCTRFGDSPKAMAAWANAVITCLPSQAISAQVLETVTVSWRAWRRVVRANSGWR